MASLRSRSDTEKNKETDSTFFNNYLLQIKLPLDSAIYENIEAPGGAVASAGKGRQVIFTVMPEKEGSFTVNADVSDLEMESIEIAAIPFVMSIDAPDPGSMEKDMNSLSSATAEINWGVGELQKGIAGLNSGVASLYDGSAQYKNGVNELDHGSLKLVEGSASIKALLREMSKSIGTGSGDMNLNDFEKWKRDSGKSLEAYRRAGSGLRIWKISISKPIRH